MTNAKLKITIDDIKNAYRKLKHYVYYDNSNLFVRKQLAEFESTDYELKFENLQIALNEIINRDHESIKKLNPYFNHLLSSMSCWSLPKSYHSDNKSDMKILSNIVADDNIEIKKIIHFVNAPIELHITSVLWIIREGYVLQKGQEDLYGYKLELDSDGEVVNGLRLFKPYYEEYQKWRDKSIQTAKNIIEEKKNTLIISLDIKDYYHSIELDEANLLQTIGTYSQANPLTSVLFEIHKYYTKNILKENSKPILPIGLLSSGILANYYLRDFDQQVKKKINPLYYGRYVDDILLTLCVDSSNQYLNIADVIKKYFTDTNILSNHKNGDEKQVTYQLEPKKYHNLKVQNDKISVMFFDHRSSLAMLDRFVKEIRKSSSEYRFLPDEELANESFEESTIKIIYDGSVNKLRSIKEFQEDRFTISSFLAKKIFLSLQVQSKIDPTTSTQILQFFRDKKSLEYHTLWEKIFTYFIITKDKKSFYQFISNTTKVFGKLPKKDNKTAEDFLTYLSIAISSAAALRPQFYKMEIFNKAPDKIKKILPAIEIVIELRKADLTRKGYMKYSILNFSKDSNIEPYIDFIEPEKIPQLMKPERMPSRFIHLHEITLLEYLFRIENGTLTKNLEDNKSVLEFSKKLFECFNDQACKDEDYIGKIDAIEVKTDQAKWDNQHIYTIGINKDECKESLNVALANISIDEVIFSKPYIGNPKPSAQRKIEIKDLINQSVKEHADLLVLPECSIPLEWLSWIITYANKNQLAMVFGMEHIVSHGYAYNIIVTLLPIKMGKYNSLVVDFRLKNHYSPEEERILKGYRYKIPKYDRKSYHHFIWKNISFTAFNCFELTDIHARAMFKSKVDLVVASEFNKDTAYFSNIIESSARDLHCYFIQSNDAKYGDNRIHQPSRTDIKDLLKIKGGQNTTILTSKLNISKLREFQVLEYELQKDDPSFKPTPPDFDKDSVEKRIQNCVKMKEKKNV